MKIEFTIPGACVPKERPRSTWRSGKVITYTPQRSRTFMKLAKVVAQDRCNKLGVKPIPYPEPVKMTVEFTLNRQTTARPDIVNLLAALCDALEGICYENDSQVVELHSIQKKGKYPVTEVTVEPSPPLD